MAYPVKCFLCKLRIRVLLQNPHTQKPGVVVRACDPRDREVETVDPWGSLARLI